MNNNTGILTFIDTLNYGAELQAYALTQTISKLGYQAELINYRCPAIDERETPHFPSPVDLTKPKHFFGLALKYPELIERKKGFTKFTNKYTPLGASVSSAGEMLKIYDRIVVGSDQVWRPDTTGEDDTFFVPGVRKAGQKVIPRVANRAGRGNLPAPA